MKRNGLVLILAVLFLVSACSFSSSNSQDESTDNTSATSESIQPNQQQGDSQPIEVTPTADTTPPVSVEIYEYKEGWTSSDQFLQSGDGWKPYHAKFRVVLNIRPSGQNIADFNSLQLNQSDTEKQAYIMTAEGYSYGNTTDTAFTVDMSVPLIVTQLDLFHGVPIGFTRSLNDGSILDFSVNFSIPEKLTPQKLVIPTLNYTVDLPPLGTDDLTEIKLATDQIVNFPAEIKFDDSITVKVSNFNQDDTYITIDYEIINNNIANNQSAFSYAGLIDSYGFVSREIAGVYSECENTAIKYEDINLGPGQSKTGTLCFKKNTNYQSSFYVLYFSTSGYGIHYGGVDNKSILIKP